MKKYAFIIDVGKCENCNNCFLSCKDEHCGNDWPGYTGPQPLHGHRWLNIQQKERGEFPQVDVAYLPTPCMHCDDAPCVRAGGGAVTKRDDGIVLIDQQKAKRNKELVKVCPYGVIWWNEQEQVPQKCTMCAHLLDEGWAAPRCVQACPTGALSFFRGDDKELERKIVAEELSPLSKSSAAGSRPRCYYKNLYRFSHCFLAGSVATMVAGCEECAAGVKVVLYCEGLVVAEQQTDDFGDFRFDRIVPGGQEYTVEIQHHDRLIRTEPVQVKTSLSVGTVKLPSAGSISGQE